MCSGSICIEAGPLEPGGRNTQSGGSPGPPPPSERLWGREPSGPNLHGAGLASPRGAGRHFALQPASAACFRLPPALLLLSCRLLRVPPPSRGAEARAAMLPRRRRARAGPPEAAPSSAARFPGVAIYLAEPRMGRSRRAFLTRLALSKGFRVLDAYRCAVPARLAARRGHLPGARLPWGRGAGAARTVSPHWGPWPARVDSASPCLRARWTRGRCSVA